MPIMATGGDSKTFEPAPAGLHQAVCVDVVDMGWLEVTYNGKTSKKHKIRIAWQIDEARDDGKRFLVQKRYTLSLHEKATLRHELEGWRGKAFTDAELKDGFDLEKLIGVNCFLNVVHVQKNGQTYANVAGVVPLKKGMPPIQPASYVRVQDRTPEQTADAAMVENDLPTLTDDDIPF
jgi:hypothetical protein